MINYRIEAEAIKDIATKAQTFLVIAHKNPDGDTLGCACAWLHYLKSRGKEVRVFCLDPVPDYLTYLPGSAEITTDTKVFNASYDAIIVNDAGSMDYAGIDVLLPDRKGAVLVNIDHHRTNTKYGDINLVLDTAGSTTEIVARLLLYWGVALGKEIAQSLLSGLVTDTDHLTNPATGYQSLETAAHLIRAGGDLYTIAQNTLKNKSIGELRLWGVILSRLRRNKRYNVISTYVTDQDLAEYGVDDHAAEGLINYLTLIPDVNMIMMFREKNDGAIKASLRTVKDTIDIGVFAARHFGGGGHRKASGFTIPGRLNRTPAGFTIV